MPTYAFLQSRWASFRTLASSEFHQILFSLWSDFRIGQAASYDLVFTEWTLFASTLMFSFEKDTGTGGKIIRSFHFYSNLSSCWFQHVRRTLRNILAWYWILLLTWNLMHMWSENDSTLPTCQPTTRSPAHWFTKVKFRTSSSILVMNVGLLQALQKFRSTLTQYASRSYYSRVYIGGSPYNVMCICIGSYSSRDLFIFKIM